MSIKELERALPDIQGSPEADIALVGDIQHLTEKAISRLQAFAENSGAVGGGTITQHITRLESISRDMGKWMEHRSVYWGSKRHIERQIAEMRKK